MIADLQQIADDTDIRGKIAIIGAGAAGITLALELATHFKDVLLLESGGLEFEEDTQNLYHGRVRAPGMNLVTSRLRFFGGSTNHWEGQCAPLDLVDFERIAARPYSGWPFTLDDLMPYYERAYPYCELGSFRKQPVLLERAEPIARQIIDSPEFSLTEFRHSPPTRFADHFGSELRTSDRIKVLLHANVTDLSISSNGNSVSSLEAQTLTGRKLKVTADAFVLCCGGIENARILLNCTRYFPRGIGNEYDLVGRFFMERLVGAAGYILPSNQHFKMGLMEFRSGYDGDVPMTVALKTSATAVREHGSSCSIFLRSVFEESERVYNLEHSPAYVAFRTMIQDVKSGHFPRELAKQSRAVLSNIETVATALYYRLSRSYRNRGPLKAIFARFESEQMPNRDSRITLIDEVDALGMRRVEADWKVLAQDINNLNQTVMALARGVGASGFGRMAVERYDEKSQIVLDWHQMGTTRMHVDPRQGVVDQNCRVHGLTNFFIAGSSVFPTAGRVNPTLTILALAIRLADYLKLNVKNA